MYNKKPFMHEDVLRPLNKMMTKQKLNGSIFEELHTFLEENIVSF